MPCLSKLLAVNPEQDGSHSLRINPSSTLFIGQKDFCVYNYRLVNLVQTSQNVKIACLMGHDAM
jgi:hypothetical protein